MVSQPNFQSKNFLQPVKKKGRGGGRLVRKNYASSSTRCYAYLKLYELRYSSLLLTEDAFSESGMSSLEKLKPLFLRPFWTTFSWLSTIGRAFNGNNLAYQRWTL